VKWTAFGLAAGVCSLELATLPPTREARSEIATATPPSVPLLPLGLIAIALGFCVEALGRQYVDGSVEQLDLAEDVVAEAVNGIDGNEGEAPVNDRRLVDWLALQLGCDRHRAAHER
jgi:hypothetical protein